MWLVVLSLFSTVVMQAKFGGNEGLGPLQTHEGEKANPRMQMKSPLKARDLLNSGEVCKTPDIFFSNRISLMKLPVVCL